MPPVLGCRDYSGCRNGIEWARSCAQQWYRAKPWQHLAEELRLDVNELIPLPSPLMADDFEVLGLPDAADPRLLAQFASEEAFSSLSSLILLMMRGGPGPSQL